MASPNSSFTQIMAATLRNYVSGGDFADQVYTGLRLYKALKAKGRILPEEGGSSVVEQLEFSKNTTSAWMGEYSFLDTRPQEVLSAAEFAWTQLAGTAIVTDKEIATNAGRFRMGNLAKAKVGSLIKSLRDQLNTAIFSDGSDATVPVGLEAIVATSGTVGGIDRSVGTNAFWKAQVDATGGALSATAMAHLFNSCTQGALYTPDLIVTTQTLQESYESLLVGKLALPGPSQNDLGYQSFNFKGSDLFFDPGCPAGVMYFLNSGSLRIAPLAGNEFQVKDPVRPANQLLQVSAATWFGAITVNNPRLNGALRNRS